MAFAIVDAGTGPSKSIESCDEILCQYGNNPQQTDAKGHNHPRTNSGSLAMLAAMAVTGFSSVSGGAPRADTSA